MWTCCTDRRRKISYINQPCQNGTTRCLITLVGLPTCILTRGWKIAKQKEDQKQLINNWFQCTTFLGLVQLISQGTCYIWPYFVFSDINECVNSPCQNGATCINTHGGYHCKCKPGFKGNQCEQGKCFMIENHRLDGKYVCFSAVIWCLILACLLLNSTY